MNDNLGNELTTSCKECVFAEYEEKTQTGCKTGRLDKYREKGVDIIEAEDLEENEFFVIESWCNHYRDKDWAESKDISEDQESNLLNKMREETVPPLGFLVLFDKNSTLDDLNLTIEQIKLVEDKISYIIISDSSEEEYTTMVDNCQKVFGEESEHDWKLSKLVEKDAENLRSIDLVFSHIKNGYYYVLKSGQEPVTNIVELLDKRTNDELDPVAYVKFSDDDIPYAAQATMHKYLNGNYGMPLIEKIKGIQSEDGSKISVVWSLEELSNGRT